MREETPSPRPPFEQHKKQKFEPTCVSNCFANETLQLTITPVPLNFIIGIIRALAVGRLQHHHVVHHERGIVYRAANRSKGGSRPTRTQQRSISLLLLLRLLRLL